MKPRAQLALGAAIALSLAAVASCSSLVGWASREPRDWRFIQSVGGLAIGTPYRSESGNVLLPVDCDVSGRYITVQPTAANSGLHASAPAVSIREQSIYLTLRTELAQQGGYGARCPDAELGQLPPGQYSVSYLSPDGSEHSLGSIEVPRP